MTVRDPRWINELDRPLAKIVNDIKEAADCGNPYVSIVALQIVLNRHAELGEQFVSACEEMEYEERSLAEHYRLNPDEAEKGKA